MRVKMGLLLLGLAFIFIFATGTMVIAVQSDLGIWKPVLLIAWVLGATCGACGVGILLTSFRRRLWRLLTEQRSLLLRARQQKETSETIESQLKQQLARETIILDRVSR